MSHLRFLGVMIVTLVCVNSVGISGHSLQAPSGVGQICPPLSEPDGDVKHVANVAELVDAVNDAAPNTTILADDGIYNLDGAYLRFDTPGVTLRSASGNR